MTGIENTNQIGAFLHCALCIEHRPNGASPREWARLEVGYTERGIQVWCIRHEVNVIHIDFEGMKFHANTTRQDHV